MADAGRFFEDKMIDSLFARRLFLRRVRPHTRFFHARAEMKMVEDPKRLDCVGYGDLAILEHDEGGAEDKRRPSAAPIHSRTNHV